jgi:poly(3-hydroxybutyrate) depolymerase
VFAAVGVHSGLAVGSAHDLGSALAAMQGQGSVAASGEGARLPTIVFHGDADSTVHPVNGEQVAAAARQGEAGQGAWSSEEVVEPRVPRGRTARRSLHRSTDGRVVVEHWRVAGAAHAWSGGNPAGSYTDPSGPDATSEMLRFFARHRRRTVVG